MHITFGQTLSEGAEYFTLYVSSSKGSDDNNGQTSDKPLKTIRKATQKRKAKLHILLKCGDVFFENISGLSDCIIESYGKGEKPVLCGFKILKNTKAWQADTIQGVWRLDLSQETDFTGFSLKNASNKACFNNIGCIYDSNKDKMYGHIVNSKGLMQNEGDIFTSSHFKKESAQFKYLYFKLDRHPESLGNICLSTYNCGISFMTNCIIRNIAIMGFAQHGIYRINHTEIQNCNIDIIGGSILVGYQYWVRYGNGIECWIPTNTSISHNTITRCTISRTYDCGATIQGKGKNMSPPYRIRFINNKFIYCRQAFEHWLSPTDSCSLDYIDCEFSGNICFMMGENQFNSPKTQDANLLSYDRCETSLHIHKNIFYGASYYCGRAFAKNMAGNRIYIYEDQYLNHYHGVKNYPKIYATDEKSIDAYRTRTKDNSRIQILEKGSKTDRKIKRKLMKDVSYTPIKLDVVKIVKLEEKHENNISK